MSSLQQGVIRLGARRLQSASLHAGLSRLRDLDPAGPVRATSASIRATMQPDRTCRGRRAPREDRPNSPGVCSAAQLVGSVSGDNPLEMHLHRVLTGRGRTIALWREPAVGVFHSLFATADKPIADRWQARTKEDLTSRARGRHRLYRCSPVRGRSEDYREGGRSPHLDLRAEQVHSRRYQAAAAPFRQRRPVRPLEACAPHRERPPADRRGAEQ